MEYCQTIVCIAFFENIKKSKRKENTNTPHTKQNKMHSRTYQYGCQAKRTIWWVSKSNNLLIFQTRFEKFIEAFYYFNKNGKTKEKVYS